MEGYLNKEGHNLLHDQKPRYVVIKENKLYYYTSLEDFNNNEASLACLEMALVSLKTEVSLLHLLGLAFCCVLEMLQLATSLLFLLFLWPT